MIEIFYILNKENIFEFLALNLDAKIISLIYTQKYFLFRSLLERHKSLLYKN